MGEKEAPGRGRLSEESCTHAGCLVKEGINSFEKVLHLRPGPGPGRGSRSAATSSWHCESVFKQ